MQILEANNNLFDLHNKYSSDHRKSEFNNIPANVFQFINVTVPVFFVEVQSYPKMSEDVLKTFQRVLSNTNPKENDLLSIESL